MNIEDEEMNLLPAGTKMELIRIMRIRDVKKLTDICVKGNPKNFKVDKTFLKHNVSHLLCGFKEHVRTINGSKLEHEDPQQHPVTVAGSKIGLNVLFRKKATQKMDGRKIPTAHQFWQSASKANSKDEVGVSEFTRGWNNLVGDMHKACGWEGKYSMDQLGALVSTLVTIECSSQSPHHNYHLQSGANEGDENTVIFTLSKKGTFLVVWVIDCMTKQLVPAIVWVKYSLGIKFGKRMLHDGGLGAASSLEEFIQLFLIWMFPPTTCQPQLLIPPLTPIQAATLHHSLHISPSMFV